MRCLICSLLIFLALGKNLWAAQGLAWVEKTPADTPPVRSGHAMAYDAARNQMVLFGGYNETGRLGDTWVWDGTNWTQKNPKNSPSARDYTAMAYDAAHGQVVLFGGSTQDGTNSETWTWNGTDWTLHSPAKSPSERSDHAMVYDTARNQTVLYGGREFYGPDFDCNDTWVWDGTNWTQKSPAISPPKRCCHALAFDATRSQTVLFGGAHNDWLADTWVWDGTNWMQKTPAISPSKRDYHSMAFDPAGQGQVVLFSGYMPGVDIADTWFWDGMNWAEKIPAPNSYASHSKAMAYDIARGQIVMFGGWQSSVGDTWILQLPSFTISLSLSQQVNIGLGDAISGYSSFIQSESCVRKNLTEGNGAGTWFYGPTIDFVKAGYGPTIDLSGNKTVIEYTARYFQGNGNTNPYADAPIILQLLDSEGRRAGLGISYGAKPNPTYPSWVTCTDDMSSDPTWPNSPGFDLTRVVKIMFVGTDWVGTGNDFVDLKNLKITSYIPLNKKKSFLPLLQKGE